MKKYLILIFSLFPLFLYSQSGEEIKNDLYTVSRTVYNLDSAKIVRISAEIASDSIANLKLGVDIATSADSVLVMDDGKLKVMSKAEFLADIYSALNQMVGLDMVAPTIDSIEVGRYNDSILVAFFHESDIHVDSIPPVSAFNLTVGGTTVGLDTILFSATGDSMMVVMDSLAEYEAIYLLDYTKTYTHVQDSSGNDLASFSNMAVSNYVTLPADTLGPEMITNGVFASGTGWTAATGWTIGSGVATYDDATSDALLTQTDASMVSGMEANTTYRLTFTSSIDVSYFDISNAVGSVQYYSCPGTGYPSGTVVARFTTPADIGTGGITFIGKTFAASAFNIDNVSLKKVL